jgi:nicotinate-nucleotide adenylyltransferase
MKLGFFGGTFDPPHIGHFVLAAEGLYQLGLDRLEWILTPLPPHKNPGSITPVTHRLPMLEGAIKTEKSFALSRVDLDRPPPHFTADTMEKIRSTYPEAQLTYLVGEDSLRDLPNWHQPRRFLASIDQLAVMERPGIITDVEKLDQQVEGLISKIRFLRGPKIEISSSEIRRRIRETEPYRYFLLAPTYRYIQKNNLYRT